MPTHKPPYTAINPATGQAEGVDPRTLTPEELSGLDPIKSPGKAIRERCVDCSGGQPSEVRKCVATDCALWPFRMGNNPFHKRAAVKGKR